MALPSTTSRKSVYGLVTAALLSAAVFTSGLVALPQPNAAMADIAGLDATRSLSPLVEKVMPAVVSVEVKLAGPAEQSAENGGNNFDGMSPEMRQFFEQFPGFKFRAPPGGKGRPDGGGSALGSGFVLTADGYVVTNNHVVQGAESVKVKFQNDESFDATVIGTDPKTDLALLKIKSDKAFPFVAWSKVEAKVGDTVMAIGNPFGLAGTVTRGIISARGRDIGTGPYDDFLQIDASINKGNSGGPTFNLDGEVIGINTAIYSPSGGSVGIGFAIPAAAAASVIESLKADKKVIRGWLGVQMQPISADIADSLGLAGTKGVLVADLPGESPALKAGVKIGDAILKVDDNEIADAKELAKVIGGATPGQTIALSIIRDGKPDVVKVTLGTMPTDKSLQAQAAPEPAPKPEPSSLSGYGFDVETAADGKGVKVTRVELQSAAAEAGIKEGDVILKVAGHDVTDAQTVADALKKATGKKVLMLVKNAQSQGFVALDKAKG